MASSLGSYNRCCVPTVSIQILSLYAASVTRHQIFTRLSEHEGTLHDYVLNLNLSKKFHCSFSLPSNFRKVTIYSGEIFLTVFVPFFFVIFQSYKYYVDGNRTILNILYFFKHLFPCLYQFRWRKRIFIRVLQMKALYLHY